MPSKGAIERLEQEDNLRRERLRSRARGMRNVVHESVEKPSRGSARHNATVSLGSFQLGWVPGAIGDLAIQKAYSIATAKAWQAERPPVVHVKNGRPLTAHGAKLLGVPWPADS